MAGRSLNEWLAWLETLSPREIDLGLERVLEVLGRLGLEKPARVVHVAGTNGKGSCSAMLEALFLGAGKTVGCYTSPHVRRYNERIRINGEEAGDGDIVGAFEAVESVRHGVPLTYFEYGTLAALVLFARRGADVLVLEIGMGGRLDAVNAIEPDGGIITNISLDHCEWLGSDVQAIAREKAGIMRAGKPVVFGSADVPQTLLAEAQRTGADLRLAGRDFRHRTANGGRWTWEGRQLVLDGLVRPSLAGRFQLDNAAAVLALLEALDLGELLTTDAINSAFGKLALPGRLQWCGSGRWLLDVAHNPDAAGVLAEALPGLAAGRAVTAIVGVLADKDVDGILRPLVPVVDDWIATTASSARALEARALAQSVANVACKPCLVVPALPDAMEEADRRAADNMILVTGSFYTVGPALEWLDNRQK
jgi:dihydrofolate synthase / folylpolyglutamate synthase